MTILIRPEQRYLLDLGKSTLPNPDAVIDYGHHMTMTNVQRCFIALNLSGDVIRELVELQKQLPLAGINVCWARAEQMHLTLLFLGGLDPGQVDGVKERMTITAQGTNPFELRLGGIGYFGSARSPRVVWVGVIEPSGKLARLQCALKTTIGELPLELESRPFHPHITLARLRPGRSGRALTTAWQALKMPTLGPVRIEAIHLYASELRPRGSHYHLLATTPLQGEA